jgi:hypothetical protein
MGSLMKIIGKDSNGNRISETLDVGEVSSQFYSEITEIYFIEGVAND